MKTIILVRHAKSSWKYDVDDRHRPLKTIGIKNTIKVCNRFNVLQNQPLKHVYSSPAKRALDTCKLFVEHYNPKSHIDINITEDLYDFQGNSLVQFVKSLPDSIPSVYLFGHNNAFNNFVNTYGDIFIDNVPTSGLVLLEFDIDHWTDLKPGTLKLKLFPKALD
ncbi:phosphoglycerate mutase [Formosa agariphila KMM 3901]|uniref:Phosphoglycerate mutase n=1 Tax=Formosa agariphila (strain DSM 15362 / KCTC 12365 / LMG 23005 / KMM 3901 / M-2Alg 35-1) TaxID=1347342 RepID=T2KPY3_FORAG|nr:histidine phosphatase family protein [Formosa agariphila]CDF80049.1 phosphoglycerate mutase [Formosa agariphila KMM 3901]